MRLATAVEHASPVARGDTGVTREARAEAAANRAAFDASALVAPYLVALSAGSPIWRGMLAGIDARFPVLPPPRTKWTRRVPQPVLVGHAACQHPCTPVLTWEARPR